MNNLNLGELRQQIQELRLKLTKLTIENSINRLKDYSQIKKTRRTIARTLTLINQKGEEEQQQHHAA